MMQSVRIRSRVGPDGILHLELPVNLTDQDLEVTITYQPLEASTTPEPCPEQEDPLIGLFSGSPDLATRSEEILHQQIQPESGWTWKQP